MSFFGSHTQARVDENCGAHQPNGRVLLSQAVPSGVQSYSESRRDSANKSSAAGLLTMRTVKVLHGEQRPMAEEPGSRRELMFGSGG